MLKAGLANLQGHQNFVYVFFWPGPGADSQGKADQDEPDNPQKGENQVAGARDAYDPEDHDGGGEEEVEEVDDDVVPDVE